MEDDRDEIYRRAFNNGVRAAIGVMRGGIHAATKSAELWGVVDDDTIMIAAMEKLIVRTKGGAA